MRQRRATLFRLIAIAVALLVLAVTAIGLTIWRLRSDALEAAAGDTASLATAMAEQTTRSIQSIDLVLADLRDQVRLYGVTTRREFVHDLDTPSVHAVLRERLERLPQADFVALVSLDGVVINTSRIWPAPKADLRNVDYVRNAGAGAADALFVGQPRFNRVSGIFSLFFSRPIFNEGGRVIGIAVIGMRVSSLQTIYESVVSQRQQTFSLMRNDGTILVRYPDSEGLVGRRLPPASPFYAASARPNGGSYRVPGYFDGDPRLVTVRPVQHYPMALGVSVTEASVLAGWSRRATLIALGTLAAGLCLAVLLAALFKHFKQLADSEAQLAERETLLADQSRELESANAKLDAALNNMTQGLCMFDRHGRLVVCNDTYLRMYALSEQRVHPGTTLRELLEARRDAGNAAPDIEAYIADLQRQLAEKADCYIVTELNDGRVVAVHNRRTAEGGWVATHEDITARQRAEARIAHMARHDALTDLGNRTLFEERLATALVALENEARRFCVFIFDLDLFKTVNDSLGHPTGDALLKSIAARLAGLMAADDTVARLGGDEFAVLRATPEGADQRDDALMLANRLIDAIGEPYEIDGNQIVIGVSVGIAQAPQDGATATRLMKNADLALYRAKAEGRNCYRLFAAGMDAELRMRHALEADLRTALAADEFFLEYQTLYAIGTGEPCGAEALVRWRHPQHGVVPPDRFIPLAEELGLIVPLGEWVLRQACRAAAHWPAHIKLAVNLSAVQFRAGNILETVTMALAEAGLMPDRLELEITETALLYDHASTLMLLHQLKSLGVAVALDDFGTGFSSMRHLRIFPFDKLKIDRSFVAEMADRADCAAIVNAFAAMGRSLDMITTAEGVETEEQVTLLRAAGVSEMQGYLTSRPCPAAALDFRPWLPAGTAATKPAGSGHAVA